MVFLPERRTEFEHLAWHILISGTADGVPGKEAVGTTENH